MERSIKDLSASLIIRIASEQRERSDYLDFFVASKEEAQEQVKWAEQFMEWIEKYLKSNEVVPQLSKESWLERNRI